MSHRRFLTVATVISLAGAALTVPAAAQASPPPPIPAATSPVTSAAPTPRARRVTGLSITMRAAPPSATVTVTGPKQTKKATRGYTVTLHGSKLLKNLKPGKYVVTATSVGRWHPTPRRSTMTVRSSRISSLRVTWELPPSTVPSEPRNVVAVAGDGTVVVTWDPPASDGGSPILEYRVITYGSDRYGQHECVGLMTRCTVSGLTNGATYKFTVLVFNAHGASEMWGQSEPVTPLGLPGAPASASGNEGDASVSVSWSPPSYDGGRSITGYTVTSQPDGRTCTATPPTTTCIVNGLTNGTAYTFAVTATTSVGTSAPRVTARPVTPRTIPGMPTDVVAVEGQTRSINVSWVAPVSDGGAPITGYTLVASPGGRTCQTTELSCTVTGLGYGTAYTFTVRATNAAGNSPTTPATSPLTLTAPIVAPSPPQSVSASIVNGGITVSWGPPASDGSAPIVGYTATASPGGGQCTTTGAHSCPFPDLIPGTTYTFTVTATNGQATSPASGASAPVTMPMPPPAPTVPRAPQMRSAVAGIQSAAVTWWAPSSDGGAPITHYTVTSTPGNQQCTTAVTTRTCVVTGLTSGTAYTFTVTATNSVGASPPSDASDAVTPWDCALTGSLIGKKLTDCSLPGVNLANMNLSGADLSGANLTNASLYKANLTNANLTGAYLAGATFTGATLTGAKLASSTLTGVRSGSISGIAASLPSGWRLGYGYLVGRGAYLTNANLDRFNMYGLDLTSTTLTGARLTGVNFNYATLDYATLTNANLTGAYLHSTSISGTQFGGATLTGVSSGSLSYPATPSLPSGWVLRNGYLLGSGANLPGANLAGQNLSGLGLWNVNLRSANLTGANLSGSNFSGADLSGAAMTGVTLTGAALGGAAMYSIEAPNTVGEPATLPSNCHIDFWYLRCS